jgi:hypothetical protein
MCTAAHLMLERNEVIALVNLLGKLSDSVETVRALNVVLDQQEADKAAAATAPAVAGSFSNSKAQPAQAESGGAHGSSSAAPNSAGTSTSASSQSAGSQNQATDTS